MLFNEELFELLLQAAADSPRLRYNQDLRNSSEDTSQRMLNSLQPGTLVPVHCHEETSETVICLTGRLDEIIYEKTEYGFLEVDRHQLCPREGRHGMQVPKGTWHSIEVYEPSVIFEAKDGAYVSVR